jgi:hypothetical protein
MIILDAQEVETKADELLIDLLLRKNSRSRVCVTIINSARLEAKSLRRSNVTYRIIVRTTRLGARLCKSSDGSKVRSRAKYPGSKHSQPTARSAPVCPPQTIVIGKLE